MRRLRSEPLPTESERRLASSLLKGLATAATYVTPRVPSPADSHSPEPPTLARSRSHPQEPARLSERQAGSFLGGRMCHLPDSLAPPHLAPLYVQEASLSSEPLATFVGTARGMNLIPLQRDFEPKQDVETGTFTQAGAPPPQHPDPKAMRLMHWCERWWCRGGNF